MTRHWEQTTRHIKTGRWAALFATMNAKGKITITRFTWERLGEPEAFHLLFDRINSTIGLKPTRLATDNAFPAASHGTFRGKVIYAFQMMQEFGVTLSETIRFSDVTIDDDGILLLNLKTARPVRRPITS